MGHCPPYRDQHPVDSPLAPHRRPSSLPGHRARWSAAVAQDSLRVDPDPPGRPRGEGPAEAEVRSGPLPRAGRPRSPRPFLRADAHPAPRRTAPEWIVAVRADDLPSMHTFINGLERDLAAVTAGLTLPWSSGVVEGHVNRIKMIKRQTYGRAGFTLLRKRVLLAS
ncbi:transposase [Streptomyces sp. NPDC006514]|uniref:transposase n=1 Tax=Streptomyces sp. NPDC006514 TaxID=3154308 RepID=UPI0033AB47D6